MVVRIPYPVVSSKYCTVSSEVATMDFLRSSGLPIPQVYGYSATQDNAAKTEYIFMEYVRGKKLSDALDELEESDIVSISQQIVHIESRIMSMPFPAGGSLYYTDTLEKDGTAHIPLENKRFSIGPDTSLVMWHGRRAQLDVDRGPCKPLPDACIKSCTNNGRRQKRRGDTHSSSSKGNSLP